MSQFILIFNSKFKIIIIFAFIYLLLLKYPQSIQLSTFVVFLQIAEHFCTCCNCIKHWNQAFYNISMYDIKQTCTLHSSIIIISFNVLCRIKTKCVVTKFTILSTEYNFSVRAHFSTVYTQVILPKMIIQFNFVNLMPHRTDISLCS